MSKYRSSEIKFSLLHSSKIYVTFSKLRSRMWMLTGYRWTTAVWFDLMVGNYLAV